MMKKGDLYKGFRCLDVVDVTDCSSKGIWVKHEKTGFEVFQLFNNDEENLFSFCIKTPSLDSTGAAHVLEHSVLCGSQKYPLKDPFISMANQSVNTFLNAMTYSDHTVFPSASTVRSDYFNIMSVYADAVYFPLLENEIFMQECHRLELDEKGHPSIQGVVYNEMKGSYSNFTSVCYDAIEHNRLNGTSYAFDSGGDPEHIPELTHEMLKSFHARYYSPANSLVFLYGNIPLEEQLDFFIKNILEKFENYGKAVEWEKFPENHKVEAFLKTTGPCDEGSKNTKSVVNLSWTTFTDGKDRPLRSMENLFLSNLLWGSDTAPVCKALLDSGLGSDISYETGSNMDCLFPGLTVGLRDVDAVNAKKIQSIIEKTLEKICKEGIPQDDLKRTCMAFDFSNREIRRSRGPYSLVYMDRCFRGWLYGNKPWETLEFGKLFKTVSNKVMENKEYLSEMIEKYFLKNPEKSLVCVTPSSAWTKQRIQAEKRLALKQLSCTTKEAVLENIEKMHAFQNEEYTEEQKNIIPKISVKDLSTNFEKINTQCSSVEGINLFTNKLSTNGILYFEMAFPVDVLPASEYPYVPMLCGSVTQCGWKDLTWDQALSAVKTTTGGMGCYPLSVHVPENAPCMADKKEYEDREWMVFYFKVLEDNCEQAFKILSDCITGAKFNDDKRLKDLINASHSGFVSEIVPSAHVYASVRSTCEVNRSSAISEIWGGISSFYTMVELTKTPVDKVASHLRNIFARIKKGGCIFHMTGTQEGLTEAKKCLPQFIKDANLSPLQESYANTEADFYKLTELPVSKKSFYDQKDIVIDELFEIPGTVGYDAMAFESASFDTVESVADYLYSHSLSKNELWKAVRMNGGAYGVWLSPNSDVHCSKFITYRDPKPYESLNAFLKEVEEVSKRPFTQQEVDKAITGCYTDEVSPMTPQMIGSTAFIWQLYGRDNAQKARRLKRLLTMKADEVSKSAVRHIEKVKNRKTVIFCGKDLISSKMMENTSKFVKLPL